MDSIMTTFSLTQKENLKTRQPDAPDFGEKIARLLTEADRNAFDALCARDPIRFLTPRLNIEARGIAGPVMRVWGAFDSDGETLLGIATRFNNTLVAVDLDGGCGPLFAALVDLERDMAGIRGTRETLLALRGFLRHYRPGHWDESVYMVLEQAPACSPERMARARPAAPSDLDKLAILYGGAGLMYRSRANIAAKLEKRDRIFVVEAIRTGWRNGRIVSCALLNVEGAEAGLIGGVYTLPDFRGRGYAAACVSALSLDLQAAGKMPCLFYENPIAGRVYQGLGFTESGRWAVQYLGPPRRK